MIDNGLVSIIMPSYNTAKYIRKAIESVQNQTYENWELIIIDDCSTDNTDEVIQQYLVDKRVRYIKNEKNSGAAISRNKGLREVKGKWIAFLDSDDLWRPEKLEKQINFMKKNQYDFSYTKYKEIDENGNDLRIEVSGPFHITKMGMYNYCWPGCLTVMYNVDKVGFIQIADIKKNNDYAIWLKVAKKVDCYLLDETLAMYRKRVGSISNHGYLKLINWHYKLFKEADKKNSVMSFILTLNNLVYGLIKKIKYKKNLK